MSKERDLTLIWVKSEAASGRRGPGNGAFGSRGDFLSGRRTLPAKEPGEHVCEKRQAWLGHRDREGSSWVHL